MKNTHICNSDCKYENLNAHVAFLMPASFRFFGVACSINPCFCHLFHHYKTGTMKQSAAFLLLFVCATAVAQPFRTPTLTGAVTTDFLATERNTPPGAGAVYAMTWDANYMYVGVTGPGAYIKDEPTLMYIDADPFVASGTGTTNGFNYDNRQPQLPFSANFVLFIKSSYGEFRTFADTSVTWSERTEVTADIITGTTDIEIRIPWAAFPGGKRPAALSFFFFKENGNPELSDAFDVRPGVSNVAETYSFDVNQAPPQLYFSLQTTDNRFYTGINLFDWINFGSACPAPTGLTTTNIRTTTARLSWQPIPGAAYYQVRGRRAGTNSWLIATVPGNKNTLTASGLVCNTNYEWHVRVYCDTTQNVDIISAFSAPLVPFKTAACAASAGDRVVVFPSPAPRGALLNLKGIDIPSGTRFTITSTQGTILQEGIISSSQIRLNERVTEGIHTLSLQLNGSPLHKQLQVVR